MSVDENIDPMENEESKEIIPPERWLPNGRFLFKKGDRIELYGSIYEVKSILPGELRMKLISWKKRKSS